MGGVGDYCSRPRYDTAVAVPIRDLRSETVVELHRRCGCYQLIRHVHIDWEHALPFIVRDMVVHRCRHGREGFRSVVDQVGCRVGRRFCEGHPLRQ